MFQRFFTSKAISNVTTAGVWSGTVYCSLKAIEAGLKHEVTLFKKNLTSEQKKEMASSPEKKQEAIDKIISSVTRGMF